MISLGYLAHRTGAPAALELLINGSSADYWADRQLPAAGTQYLAPDVVFQELAAHAILGLALSGRPEVEPVLAGLVESDLKIHALDLHAQVARLGLDGYYSAAGSGGSDSAAP